MPSPTNAALLSVESEIQRPAGISLERVHDKLWRNIRIHHDVDVVGPHLRSKQLPVFVLARLTDRFKSNLALIGVQLEGRLLERCLHILA